MTTFAKTLTAFCDDLKLSLPELTSSIDRVSTLSPADFLKMWRPHLATLKARDVQNLFQKRGGSLIGGVSLSKKLWTELSENTHAAIWKYLRTLALEAVIETGIDKLAEEEMTILMDILMDERGAEGTKTMFEESMKHLKPLLDRLKEFMPTFSTDASGATSAFPEIPERLRNGCIAKLAEDLTKQFDPTEFGIDPSMLTGDNIEDILTKLAEVFQKDPTKLMAGAKTMAEKIKRRIMGGSINRDQLISEAKEFMALLKDHPMFKERRGKFESMRGGGGLGDLFGSGSDEPSERRSTVQERLRKKLAARKSAAQSK
jgi:hypothetical protein